MAAIRWAKAEWSETALAAYVEGYALSVEVTEPSPEGAWFWAVKMTAAISEYPEVYDAGFARSQDAAKAAAEAALKAPGEE